MEKLQQNKSWIAVALAIVAAYFGGSSVDYVPDGAAIAKLGPVGIGLVIYLETRWRPLAVQIRDSLRIVAKQTDDVSLAQAAQDLDAGAEPVAVVSKLTRAQTNGR